MQLLGKKLVDWRTSLLIKLLKVKTKLMFGGGGVVSELGAWTRGLFSKDVAANSLQYTSCVKWVLGICSGVKGSLTTASAALTCKECQG